MERKVLFAIPSFGSEREVVARHMEMFDKGYAVRGVANVEMVPMVCELKFKPLSKARKRGVTELRTEHIYYTALKVVVLLEMLHYGQAVSQVKGGVIKVSIADPWRSTTEEWAHHEIGDSRVSISGSLRGLKVLGHPLTQKQQRRIRAARSYKHEEDVMKRCLYEGDPQALYFPKHLIVTFSPAK